MNKSNYNKYDLLKIRVFFILLVMVSLLLIALVYAGLYSHGKKVLFAQAKEASYSQYELLNRLVVNRSTTKDNTAHPDERWADDLCKSFTLIAKDINKTKNQQIKLIGFKPFNKNNSPLDNERKYLAKMSAQKLPITYVQKIGDREYVQTLFPMQAKESCFACHRTDSTNNKMLGAVQISIKLSSDNASINDFWRFAIITGSSIGLCLLGLIYFLGWRFMHERYQMNHKIIAQSTIDPLTEILNRRALFLALEQEIERSKRLQSSLSIVVIDIDHFASINDRYGRKMGDKILFKLATVLESELRSYDIIGRSGGQEFIVILPTTELKKSTDVAERLLAAISAKTISMGKYKTPVTVSMGLVEHASNDEEIDSFLSRAFGALKNAKANGGNRLETDDIYRIKI